MNHIEKNEIEKNQKELCKKYFLFLDEDFGPHHPKSS